jgi:hypothetical protein
MPAAIDQVTVIQLIDQAGLVAFSPKETTPDDNPVNGLHTPRIDACITRGWVWIDLC